MIKKRENNMNYDDISLLFKNWDKNTEALKVAIIIVVALIAVCDVIEIVVSIYLAIRYVKFNKKKNGCGKTGEAIARKILDDNELQKIKVKCSGSSSKD